MNPHLQTFVDFIKTERTQVIFTLVLIIASTILTVYIVLEQIDSGREIKNTSESLAQSFANQSLADKQKGVDLGLTNLQSLSNEWLQISERLASLRIEKLSSIEYKVEHYEIGQRLQKKCEQLKIQFDLSDFGINAVLSSDEDIRMRMLQLKAVELLADLALDRQIQQLVEIYPLSPIQHVDNNKKPTFTEYPVRIECDVDFTHLYSFFQSVFEENQVFVFRNIRIESGPTPASKLRVKAILSALLFD